MLPDDHPDHGKRRGYRQHGCKCDRCRHAVAKQQQLLLMRRAAVGGPLLIDKTGAVRRLQALMAMGWPRRALALEAGYQGDAFALVLNGRRRKVTRETHARIAKLYDRLCMTPGPSSPTRIRAAKKSWPPPLAWDDIDTDPAPRSETYKVRSPHDHRAGHEYDEVVVLRILSGDFATPSTHAEKREVVARWTGSQGELARLTGWKVERYTTTREAA